MFVHICADMMAKTHVWVWSGGKTYDSETEILDRKLAIHQIIHPVLYGPFHGVNKNTANRQISVYDSLPQ